MTGGRPLRLGFAGANVERGWARDAHFPALRALPGLTVHAVSARTREIADAAAREFGVARAYADSLALARDPDVDIVVVTVKVPEHRTIVLAALEAGKHLYCEWPLARDLDEARELAGAARGAGTHVALGLQGASCGAVRHAARLVREGAIGTPLNLRVVSSTAGWGTTAPPHYAYLQDRRNGATLETIAGGHTLAMVEAIVGSYRRVGAMASTLHPRVGLAGSSETVERTCADHLLVHGRHDSGCVSSVEIVGGQNEPLCFELRGTAGTLRIRGHHPGGFQCGRLEVTTSADAGPPPPAPFPELDGAAVNVAELHARLAGDIRSGERTAPDFDLGVKLTRLLDTIADASREGRTIAVPQ